MNIDSRIFHKLNFYLFSWIIVGCNVVASVAVWRQDVDILPNLLQAIFTSYMLVFIISHERSGVFKVK